MSSSHHSHIMQGLPKPLSDARKNWSEKSKNGEPEISDIEKLIAMFAFGQIIKIGANMNGIDTSPLSVFSTTSELKGVNSHVNFFDNENYNDINGSDGLILARENLIKFEKEIKQRIEKASIIRIKK